jgi:hypothetical protein
MDRLFTRESESGEAVPADTNLWVEMLWAFALLFSEETGRAVEASCSRSQDGANRRIHSELSFPGNNPERSLFITVTPDIRGTKYRDFIQGLHGPGKFTFRKPRDCRVVAVHQCGYPKSSDNQYALHRFSESKGRSAVPSEKDMRNLRGIYLAMDGGKSPWRSWARSRRPSEWVGFLNDDLDWLMGGPGKAGRPPAAPK